PGSAGGKTCLTRRGRFQQVGAMRSGWDVPFSPQNGNRESVVGCSLCAKNRQQGPAHGTNAPESAFPINRLLFALFAERKVSPFRFVGHQHLVPALAM